MSKVDVHPYRVSGIKVLRYENCVSLKMACYQRWVSGSYDSPSQAVNVANNVVLIGQDVFSNHTQRYHGYQSILFLDAKTVIGINLQKKRDVGQVTVTQIIYELLIIINQHVQSTATLMKIMIRSDQVTIFHISCHVTVYVTVTS